MDDKNDKVEPVDGRVAAALFGAFILGTAFVVVLGFSHLKNIDNAPWQFYMTVVNSIIGVAAMMLVAAGCIRGVVRNASQRRWPTCVAFGAGALFGALWAVKELVIVHRDGFPLDPLTRTIFLAFLLMVGMFLCFPPRLPDEKQTEDDKTKSENKPTPLGWGGALFAVLAALFLAYQDGFFSILTTSPGEVAADATPEAPPQRPQIPPPAKHDELSKAFVCLCPKDKKTPGGCGFFIGNFENGKREVKLMTAAHVAASCIQSGLTNDVAVIAHHGKGEPDQNITLRETGLAWCPTSRYADITMMDVTPYFEGMVKHGWDVKYIPVQGSPTWAEDDRAVEGAFMLPSKCLGSYGIGLGTPVVAYGNAYELWFSPELMDRQPLGLRSGIIAARLNAFKTPGYGDTTPPIVIECNVYPGYSGGPVFANAQIGPYAYPALIGVTSGLLGASPTAVPKSHDTFNHGGLCFITPLDEFIRSKAEIESMLKERAAQQEKN